MAGGVKRVRRIIHKHTLAKSLAGGGNLAPLSHNTYYVKFIMQWKQ